MKSLSPKTITTELLPTYGVPALAGSPAADQRDQRIERILAYHHTTRLAEATKKIAAFFTGLELLAQKEELAHGKFLTWCESHLAPRHLSYRTAARYMAFAAPLQPKWLALIDRDSHAAAPTYGVLPSGSPAPRALQLSNGLVAEENFQQAADFLKDADDGKLFLELSRDFGLSRLPKKQEHNPRKQTREEVEADRVQFANDLADDLIRFGETWHDDHESRTRIDAKKRKAIIEMCVKVANQERATLKAEKKPKPARKGAKK